MTCWPAVSSCETPQMLHALLIISKAGGLVYNKDYGTGIAKLTVNEYLVLAGTFHGVHAITAQISPMPGSSGLEMLESEALKVFCHQTPTGIKIVIITDAAHTSHELACKRIYEIYADYAMKNPFHTPEMPIRADLFDSNMSRLVRSLNSN
ncbi:Sybindin-like protein [Entophlyctis helioformis]|nr:Sybindin-like protein [Entophlyctis helioformis]